MGMKFLKRKQNNYINPVAIKTYIKQHYKMFFACRTWYYMFIIFTFVILSQNTILSKMMLSGLLAYVLLFGLNDVCLGYHGYNVGIMKSTFNRRSLRPVLAILIFIAKTLIVFGMIGSIIVCPKYLEKEPYILSHLILSFIIWLFWRYSYIILGRAISNSLHIRLYTLLFILCQFTYPELIFWLLTAGLY